MENIFESLKTFVMTENWDDLKPVSSNYTMKGHKHTEESKLLMSENRKGYTAHNKGIANSQEIRNKIKAGLIGFKLSEETKNKMSITRKGISKSEETKRRMVEAWKKRKLNNG
jgi:hypothetical protein